MTNEEYGVIKGYKVGLTDGKLEQKKLDSEIIRQLIRETDSDRERRVLNLALSRIGA